MAKYILQPKETLAILIGVSDFGTFDSIPAAPRNVEALAAVLQDPAILGLPKANVKLIQNGNATKIKRRIRDLINDYAKSHQLKNLIFYFSGHGYRDVNKKYYLVVNDSDSKDIEDDGSSGIAYSWVKNILSRPHLKRRIILLDTCYSGLGVQSGDKDMADAMNVKGSYTITSCGFNEKSYFKTDEDHTYFTDELLKLLQNGISTTEEMMAMGSLYTQLKTNIQRRQKGMTPLQQASEELTADNFFVFKNRQYDQDLPILQEIKEDYDEYMGILYKRDFAKARRRFNSLLKGLVNDIENEKKRVEWQQKITDEIVASRILERYLPNFKYSDNNELVEQIAILKKELQIATDQHKEQLINNEELEEKVKDKNDELIAIKKQLSASKALIEIYKSETTAKIITPPTIITKSKNYTEKIGDVPIEMIYVEGGTFMMGDEELNDSKPIHEVNLSPFFIGKYPITQLQWRSVMGGDPDKLKSPNNDHHPVSNVSWNDCQEFCKKLNQRTNKNYRLPTEAEWEFTARGGGASKAYQYAGSNQLDEVGWFNDNSSKQTKPVGILKPNELGIYDLSGNVYEWCSDWYRAYSKEKQTDPKGAKNGSYRVLRGGSWYSNAENCRGAYRYNRSPAASYFNYGFRLVHSSTAN